MCNAWNHSKRCFCGFGGKGHLGANSGIVPSFSHLPRFQQNVGSGWAMSFVVPNAHCPVCQKKVYFYQSESGGRVFFDELGWPWPKHPCTDRTIRKSSVDLIEVISNDDKNNEIIKIIGETISKGYAAMVCTAVKSKSLSAELLVKDNATPAGKATSVSIDLESTYGATDGTLLFLKEVSAKRGQYIVRFYFRGQQSGLEPKEINAMISTLKRPVIRKGEFQIEEFQGFPVKYADKQSWLRGVHNINQALTKKQRNKTSKNTKKGKTKRCEFCHKDILRSDLDGHQQVCKVQCIPCQFCKGTMERQKIKKHQQTCYAVRSKIKRIPKPKT